AFAELFEVGEKERFVLLNRPADIGSVIISALRIPEVLTGASGFADGDSVCERRSGVECFIHEIVKHGAVELIRSGPHRVVEVTSAGLTVLRVEVTGLNGDFLHRI